MILMESPGLINVDDSACLAAANTLEFAPFCQITSMNHQSLILSSKLVANILSSKHNKKTLFQKGSSVYKEECSNSN